MKSPQDASVVGVRASWTCALCRDTTRSYQLVLVSDPQALDLPPGWRLIGAESVCGLHPTEIREAERAADQAVSLAALLRGLTPGRE